MDEDHLDILRALADGTRQEIIEFLIKSHESHVNEICEAFEQFTQPTISHHLQVLKRSRLVQARREGKKMLYSIRRSPALEVFSAYIKLFGG